MSSARERSSARSGHERQAVLEALPVRGYLEVLRAKDRSRTEESACLTHWLWELYRAFELRTATRYNGRQ